MRRSNRRYVEHRPRIDALRWRRLRTIVRCGNPPAGPTQFALAGQGRGGAAIRSRQLRPTRSRRTSNRLSAGPRSFGPQARTLSISCEGTLDTFFGYRRCRTLRAFTAGRALTEIAPTSDVLCRLTGTAGCRLQPTGSCRLRRGASLSRGHDAYELTCLARAASCASGKGHAEHVPERLPSRQTLRAFTRRPTPHASSVK